MLGQGVGVHGHVGVEQTGAALQCAMSREAGRITRNIALKFKEAQTLDEVGQGCCISLQVVEQPWDGLFTDVGLGDFPEKIGRSGRSAMVEHSFGMYYQLFLRTGQVEIGTLKPLSLSVKVDVDVQGILKILQGGHKG